MGELQLKKISKDLIDRAEEAAVPETGLGRWLDDYFIDHLKRAEMEQVQVDPKLYEGLRTIAQTDVLPLYEQYRREVERIRERRHQRKLWHYVLGTVAALEVLEVILTRGRSLLPQIIVPTAIFYGFVGFILYMATQYLDDLQQNRARKRLEAALAGLDRKLQTDIDYDNRRQLLQEDVLRAEALEIVMHYPTPEEFWRDYARVRQADPTTSGALAALQTPAFEKFLKFHVQGGYSPMARQQRFNRLFMEAQEVFISRDRDQYVLRHLQSSSASHVAPPSPADTEPNRPAPSGRTRPAQSQSTL